MLRVYKKLKGDEMAKRITMLRIREDRADKLKDKAVELTIKSKEMIKESEIINYLLDEFTERVDIDRDGFLIKDDD